MWSEKITWKSDEFKTIEHLEIMEDADGFEVQSIIETSEVGERGFLEAYYRVTIDENWNLTEFSIRNELSGVLFEVSGSLDADGNWILNGDEMPTLKGCRHIDILPTPFTNTLPIRNLDFGPAAAHEIDVVYVDLTQHLVERKRPRYTKLAEKEFRFETVPKDFEALILLDANGLVIDYPGLFRRLEP